MSKPSSRLSAFRSYSYYHVLAMCDSSNTADLLSKSWTPDTWEHATAETRAADDRPGSKDLGKYSPKCVYDDNGNCAGRYIILIDGSTDAAFSITQARWSSSTAAAAVPDDNNASLAVEGSLNISEPKGVAFLDQVVKCSIALGVDSAQIVYCLKTFFVGYVEDPIFGDRMERITDVPPVNFIAYDVTGSFTEQGGTYEMLFVALANGASRLPQYSKAVNSLNVTAGDTLYDTMINLQKNILASYDNYYNCIVAQLEAANNPAATALRDSLCRVEYIIDVAPEYSSARYKVTDQPIQMKNTAGCGDKAQIHFPTNTSIETAIGTIMQMSPQVREDMTIGDKTTGVKYEYKVHTCVKSEPITGSDANVGKLKYTVYYRVERFMSPTTVVKDPAFQLLAQDNVDNLIRTDADSRYKTLRNNLIEFDYMYTGKNIDILEFDLKVNMGMAYLQTATLANTLKGQLEPVPAKMTSGSQPDVSRRAIDGRFSDGMTMQTPVFFGKQIGNPKFINTANSGAAIQSAYTLAKHASLEVAEAKVRIVGNDRLLHSTNKSTSPEYMMTRTGTRSMAETSEAPMEADFRDWTVTPAYVKIKIKMPRDNDDFALFTGQVSDDQLASTSNADYARDFWFDGYYYVCGIDHVFDNGEFSQTLDMISIPKVSTIESLKTSDKKDIDLNVKIEDCFDSKIGCGRPAAEVSSSEPASPIVAVPPPGEALSALDADTINNMKRRLSDVKGWDNAREDVKQAILNAAAQYNVDEVVLAQVCYQESKFDPNARPRKSDGTFASSAVGLFQFLNGTWSPNGVGVDSNLTTAVLSDKDTRYNPQYNAFAGAKYLSSNARIIHSTQVGDLYLAHFAGPGSAKKIIAWDEQTNGTATLTDAWGVEQARLYAAANKPYIREDMTVRELRTWAAVKMAKTLKNTVVSARNANPKRQNVQANPQALASAAQDPSTVPKRKASEAIASQQNCKAQETKANDSTKEEPCASTPPSEDAKRRANVVTTSGVGGSTSDAG